MTKYNYNTLNKKIALLTGEAEKIEAVPCFDAGIIDYNDAYRMQQDLFDLVSQEKLKSALILLEHPPAITIGNRGDKSNLIASEQTLEKQGISLVQSNRGGDITFHGPGQLVCYPIFNLANFGKDLTLFVYNLEKIIIDVLKEFDISGSRIEKLRGVFVGQEKIASIGIRVKKWITLHGFSFNINVNLDYFNNIVACGLKDNRPTSLKKILNNEIPIQFIKELVIKHFEKNFNIKIISFS